MTLPSSAAVGGSMRYSLTETATLLRRSTFNVCRDLLQRGLCQISRLGFFLRGLAVPVPAFPPIAGSYRGGVFITTPFYPCFIRQSKAFLLYNFAMAPVVHACPLDCPDTCSLSVTTSEGRVSAVTGTSLNPLTNDVICGKVRGIDKHMYGDHRVLTPLLRSGQKGSGTFRRASWDQALKKIAEQLAHARDNFGGESILPFNYGGSNGYLTQNATDATLFRRLGASELARTVCAAPSSAAYKGMYGKMPGVSLSDYRHANLIVVWGANLHATSIHLVPIIQQACKAGAKLIVVDPRRTKLAKQADLHLAPRPGTDLPLALGCIRWLFKRGQSDDVFLEQNANSSEELKLRAKKWSIKNVAKATGVAEDQIETFYQLYAKGSPAVIRVGWGPERNRNGGGAVAAILAMPAVAGKFGVRGGGFTMSNSGAFRLKSDGGAFSPRRSVRTINMSLLGSALQKASDQPIKFLFVYNGNPVATNPDQNAVKKGLEREDLFTVVFDSVLTDTARYADVVLPATMFLEHRELKSGYGAMALMDSRPRRRASWTGSMQSRCFCRTDQTIEYWSRRRSAVRARCRRKGLR